MITLMIARRLLRPRWRVAYVTIACLLWAPTSAIASAQGPPPTAQGRGGRESRPLRNDVDPRRAQLERRFQERLLVIVKQRLALSDDQTGKLRDVASRTEDERRALRRDELTARFAMRQELLAGDRANEGRVAELLDQMPKLERRRLELMEREQRDLSKFLTPLQRARYFGLQDELRRGMQELQNERLGAPDSTPRPLGRGGQAPLLPRRLKRSPPG